MLATLAAVLARLWPASRTFDAEPEDAPASPDESASPRPALGGRHSKTDSRGSALIVARHAAVVGLCVLAVAVPAIPGLEGLAPGVGRAVRTDDASESFLSAPACSELRPDLCLTSEAGAGGPALRQVEQIESLSAVTPEADDSSRERAAEATEAPEPWGAMAIRPGDTLIALANWFGVTPFDIAVINGAAVDDYLVIGQTLIVPVPESEFVTPPVPDVSEPAQAAPAYTPTPLPEPPTPVAAPPPDLPTAPPPSGQTWTKEEVVEAICSLPWPCETMVAIAACESGLRPDAFNPAGYYGLFQINHAFEGWDNPWTNAQVAYYEKYLPMLQWGGDGLAPWPVCRHY